MPITILSFRKFIQDEFFDGDTTIVWRVDSLEDLSTYFSSMQAITFRRLKKYIEADRRILEYFVCDSKELLHHSREHKDGECHELTVFTWFKGRLDKARDKIRSRERKLRDDVHYQINRIDEQIEDLQEKRLSLCAQIDRKISNG